MGYLEAITTGLKTLATGLGITFRHAVQKPVTLQYPKEKPELSKAYRSAIQLVRFEESATHDCVACLQCVKICPSHCIDIEGGKVEGIKKKRAEKVEMDFALCSLCGLCIDVCPTETLEYSKIYDEAGTNRNWVFDLLKDFREGEPAFRERQREIEEAEAAEKEAKKAAAAAAKAAKEAKEAKAKAEAEAQASSVPSNPAEQTAEEGDKS